MGVKSVDLGGQAGFSASDQPIGKVCIQEATHCSIVMGAILTSFLIVLEIAAKNTEKDIKEIERRYQGRWDEVMMVDFCWFMKRDNVELQHRRQFRR
ncbi:hypothetical protein ANN_26583 [Periplaneta americana]|uniref:Uncharacterized protein n=1 Tax=Periplaneta americana TaxID=6978 RepID=A0ABQ8RYR0_PERAM|nr:hypothetical protein ANN_26583 [Periplaneta americana]